MVVVSGIDCKQFDFLILIDAVQHKLTVYKSHIGR